MLDLSSGRFYQGLVSHAISDGCLADWAIRVLYLSLNCFGLDMFVEGFGLNDMPAVLQQYKFGFWVGFIPEPNLKSLFVIL